MYIGGFMMQTRNSLEFDVVIVGAGPSGLATAIRLGQLAKQSNKTLEICLLEKGAEVGAHVISGAVLDPKALNELLPGWQHQNPLIVTPVRNGSFFYLTKKRSFRLPTPQQMYNNGNYIISLGNLCRWLASIAEDLGVQILPGYTAKQPYYDDGRVVGVSTGDFGLSKQGTIKSSYQEGMDLFAKYTIIAEGCRGSLAKILIDKFALGQSSNPQTYGLGFKELWEVPIEEHRSGYVFHTIGWPLDNQTYGGSFVYYQDPNLLALGFVIGLDYENPYLNPFEEFQRFKHHPKFQPILKNGRRISYGARTISEGGLQSLPSLCFPGGLLIGCSAGFLNVSKIKGIHTAIKSGMLAAESSFADLQKTQPSPKLNSFEKSIKESWICNELYKARNIRPGFQKGLWPGIFYASIDSYLFRGKAPWTLHNYADHSALKPAKQCSRIQYLKPDNKISFDKLSSLNLSNVYHEKDQPVHIQLIHSHTAIEINLVIYDAPEQRYCPAGVYEILYDDKKQPYLQINAQNCIHCKACDIKDPTQNINWTPPEGSGGPHYSNM